MRCELEVEGIKKCSSCPIYWASMPDGSGNYENFGGEN